METDYAAHESVVLKQLALLCTGHHTELCRPLSTCFSYLLSPEGSLCCCWTFRQPQRKPKLQHTKCWSETVTVLQTIKSVQCSHCLIFHGGGGCYSYSFFTLTPFFGQSAFCLSVTCWWLFSRTPVKHTQNLSLSSNIPAQMDMNYELVVWIPVSANKNIRCIILLTLSKKKKKKT